MAKNNKSIYRHRQKIREFLNVKRWGYEDVDGRKIHHGLKLAIQYAHAASQSMDNIEQFAEEANQLSADELNEFGEAKRCTLIASLIYRSQSNAKDALAIMFCKLIAIAHKQSKKELTSKLDNSKEDACAIVGLFKDIMQDGQSIKDHTDYFAKVFYQKIENDGGFSLLTNKCNDILASHGNEYRIFLTDMIQKRRSLLFKILKTLQLNSSTQDDKLILAMKYLLNNENRRSEYVTEAIDLSFTTTFWHKQIMQQFSI